MGWVIGFYETMSGEKPAELFLAALPPKARQKALWVLKLVTELDRVPDIYFSRLPGTDHLWECRIRFGSNAYRILAFLDGVKVILTGGFSKKSPKAPTREIERAERCRKEYFQRKGSR